MQSWCLEGFMSFVRGAMIVGPVFPGELVHRVFFVMQAYLTNGWRLSFTHAAGIMNFWEGMTLVLPTLLQFLADLMLGNFTIALISSIFSAAGIGMVALSVPHILDHNRGRCQKSGAGSCLSDTQEAVFYTGMVLTALGRAGISFSIDALHDEQTSRDEQSSEGEQGSSARGGVLAWLQHGIKQYIKILTEFDKYVIYLIGSLLIMIWIHKWKVLFGLPAIYSACMTLNFISGCCWYKKPGPRKRSPVASVVRIIYAAATSKNQSQPLIQDQKPSGVFFPRCLDKALPSEGLQGHRGDNKRSFEKEEVEVARFVVGMVPISLTFIFCGIVSSIGNTYFVEQANHMNRRLGKWNAPLLALQLPIILFKHVHDFYLWLFFKKKTKDWIRNNFKIDLPIAGIGAAMLYSVCCCATAAAMEMRRLKVVRSHGLVDKPDYEQVVPMHAAWLLLQFFFLAGLDSFLRKSIEEFYTDQAPQHLRDKLQGSNADGATKRYLNTAVDFVCGLGFVFGVLSVYVVGKLSEIGGNPNWFQYTLNRSRLDRYYWVLAGLSGANLVVFQFVALGYVRRPSEGPDDPL